jgi:ribonucleoside-triphosphate reductase (formate)
MEHSGYLAGFSDGFRKLYMNADMRLLKIEGIAPSYLNVQEMAERYCNERASDMSVDANANRNEGKTYCGYLHEVTSGWLKLQGYYDIHRKIATMYSPERADELLSAVWKGDLYIHDSTAIQAPYCWACSTSFLLNKGTPWGQLHSLPPRRRHSYIDQVKELTIEIAQNIAGAVAIGDLFVNYAYFVQQENLDIYNPQHRKAIENDFQSLVHTLNKKLRPSHQSPFTNLSIFDRPNLEYLFADMRYPDGSAPDRNLIWEIQKIFCNWFKQGDPVSGFPYRFPIVTLNLRIDEQRNILDPEAFE